MSNILDKPLESVFGYITVLRTYPFLLLLVLTYVQRVHSRPTAISRCRTTQRVRGLSASTSRERRFTTSQMRTSRASDERAELTTNRDLWTKNMYLAEDRILCWELVSKRNSAWLLHYQRSAYAVTDVPDTVPDLISQRRRWLNGSFFAGLHSSVRPPFPFSCADRGRRFILGGSIEVIIRSSGRRGCTSSSCTSSSTCCSLYPLDFRC